MRHCSSVLANSCHVDTSCHLHAFVVSFRNPSNHPAFPPSSRSNNMLRCTASHIELTTSDVVAFERGFAARKASRALQLSQAQAHLRTEPTCLSTLGITVANDTGGRNRADSCISKSNFCNKPDQAEEPESLQDRSTHFTEQMNVGNWDNRAVPHNGNSFSPASSSPGMTVARKPVPLPSVPSSPDKVTVRALQQIQSSPRSTTKGLDFTIYETSAEEQSLIEAQHLDSVAQAQHTVNSQRAITGSYRPPVSASRPALVPVHANDQTLATSPAFDPGAQVFVPRTRFGSADSLSPQGGVRLSPQQVNLDSVHNRPNLRIRSSFERNAQPAQHHRADQSNPIIDPIRTQQFRRRSRTSDNASFNPRIASNGERYPSLRPQSTVPTVRRNSGSHHRQVIFPRRQSSRQHLVEYERALRNGSRAAHAAVPARKPVGQSLVVPEDYGRERRDSTQRHRSPRPHSSSRSTPNLLAEPSPVPRLNHTRSSSLSWMPQTVEPNDVAQVARMVSGERAISHLPSDFGSVPSSIGKTVMESLLSGSSSPLDELSIHFSRLSAMGYGNERARGVELSLEGRSRRTKLLTGDLFDGPDKLHDEDFDAVQGELVDEDYRYGQVVHKTICERPSQSITDNDHSEDPVALSLALPSPLRSNRSSFSPTIHHSPSSSIYQNSSLPDATATIRPVPQSPSIAYLRPAPVTPKFPIYNDSLTPTHQPQTPADVIVGWGMSTAKRTVRQEEGRIVIATGMTAEVEFVSEEMHATSTSMSTSTPTPVPTEMRHSSLSPPVAGQNPRPIVNYSRPSPTRLAPPQSQPQPVQVSTQPPVSVRRVHRNENSEGIEIEAMLARGLEDERRTWMARSETAGGAGGGGLDVTPEREGRFERFL
ncbi:unnamed protein product [Zymoseptoria tritici ST99CH_3D7]|uniref:Uncharacterized protein n=1 Tax=Zymoseptoria tritici (strain ST99CH_3D7) TaxID=1276538 RepID=A0A1X7RD66_ZYMT9|nr:unnamed protein product [Zymoseptoria tritici ST99CH_3D7]